ncbi:hypothetical protein OEZ86_006635 [Tetradesmus obliquus]|nr:hypothetical protein OEZ86_006635 [Tetradesmus obliquus]
MGRLAYGCKVPRSCAFRTASGEPIYYTGYAGPKYSPPKPSPSPSPSPSPKPVPRPASPSPIPTAQPTVPAPAPTPSPAPATAGGTACTSQPATITLNSSAVADAVVAKLWEKFSYGTNGYEISGLKASEAPATKGSKMADAVDPFAKLATVMAINLQQKTADTVSAATVQDVPAKQMLDSSDATNTASMTAAESTNTTDSLLPVRPDGPNRTDDNNATQTRRHMLASLTKQAGVAELRHPMQPQGPNMPKTNSRHVLQESTPDNSTQLAGHAAVPEAAPVSPSLPEDSNITILVPIQPPPGPRSATTNNAASSSDKPAATWEAAPACSEAPSANNTSKDDMGRL